VTLLEQSYTAAGKRYVAAFTELRAAMVDLGAMDRLVGSANGANVPGFGELPDIIRFRHGRFAPDISGHLPSDVAARFAEITRSAK
jgi:hypothetical protein